MRTLTIIGLIILVSLIGFFAWFYLGSPKGNIDNLPLPTFGIPEDGDTPTAEETPSTEETPSQGGEAEEQAIRLRQIFKNSVSGFAILERPVFFGTRVATSTGSTTPIIATTSVVRFMEKETGNIYEYVLRTLQTRRVTNTTLPRSHDATFSFDGTRVVARYLNEANAIETFIGAISEGQGGNPGSLGGEFLEENTSAVALAPTERRMFYLFEKDDAVSGILADDAGRNKKQIFQFPFTEWLLNWGTRTSILLTTKPSGLTPGYAYEINQQSGALSKVAGGLLGMTVLGDTRGDRILVGEGGQRPRLSILTRKTGQRQELSLETFPEKCAWATGSTTAYCAVPESIPEGLYPDSWYQGTISFRDAFWKISAENGFGDFLLSLGESSGTSIDVVNPLVNINQTFLVFINKADGSLWSYEIPREE